MNRFIRTLLCFLVLYSCSNKKTKPIDKNSFEVIETKTTSTVESGGEIKIQEANNMNKDGISLARAGQFNKAKHSFETALQIEPNNPTIISNMANIESSLSNFQKSENLYIKAIEVSDSAHLPALVGLAALYIQD